MYNCACHRPCWWTDRLLRRFDEYFRLNVGICSVTSNMLCASVLHNTYKMGAICLQVNLLQIEVLKTWGYKYFKSLFPLWHFCYWAYFGIILLWLFIWDSP